MSFAFIPRQAHKRAKQSNTTSSARNTHSHERIEEINVPGPNTSLVVRAEEQPRDSHVSHGIDVSTSGARKIRSQPERLKDEELIAALCLATSDYSLWVDPELRRAVDECAGGYLPIRRLIGLSPPLKSQVSANDETVVVRALRNDQRGAQLFDVRLSLTGPQYGSSSRQKNRSSAVGGGYEIRCKRGLWGQGGAGSGNTALSRQYWEDATVYVENVPTGRHGSAASFSAFLNELLGSLRSDASPLENASPPPSQGLGTSLPTVQSLKFLQHHLDAPSTPPKPKHFALVILPSPAIAQSFLSSWPWTRKAGSPPDHEDASETTTNPTQNELASRAAVKSGFRALSKARWKEMEDAYLAHRERILNSLAASDDTEADEDPVLKFGDCQSPGQGPHAALHSVSRDAFVYEQMDEETTQEGQFEDMHSCAYSAIDPNASYPPNCLIFVKNLHTETNKTTLKKLFERVLEGEGVDYVDYVKGGDSCHIRLRTPSHAQQLIDGFQDKDAGPRVQKHGLDDICFPNLVNVQKGSHLKSIELELILGRREEIYWLKVPEKVRRAAVEKALGVEDVAQAHLGHEGEGKRKRRRRK